MEYSFSTNDIGRAQANLNMEAEAFGHWLSIDMSAHAHEDLLKIAEIVDQLLAGQLYEYHYQGREFFLELLRDKVKVSANALAPQANSSESHLYESAFDDDDWQDELSEEIAEDLCDAQSGLVASCGLEDFKTLLLAWIAFLHELSDK